MIIATGIKPFTNYPLQQAEQKRESLNQPYGMNNIALIYTKYNSLLVKRNNLVNFGKKIDFPADWPYAKEPCKMTEGNDYKKQMHNDFFNLLVKYVPQSGYKSVKDNETIVSVSCGLAQDALPANSYFGRKSNITESSKNTHYYGIDIDADQLKQADIFTRDENDKKFPWLDLIKGDARKMSLNPAIPKNVDVVIMRHPHIWHDSGICANIIEDSLKILRPGGIMIFTTYFDFEKDALLEKLKPMSGFKLTVDKKTGNYDDAYIVIIKKD